WMSWSFLMISMTSLVTDFTSSSGAVCACAAGIKPKASRNRKAIRIVISLRSARPGGRGTARCACGGRLVGRLIIEVVVFEIVEALDRRVAIVHLALAPLQIGVAHEAVAIERRLFHYVGRVEQAGARLDRVRRGQTVA